MGVDRHPEGEPHATPAQVPGQPGAGPGAVAADQDRLVAGGRWQLRQCQVDQCDQVAGRTGGGVTGPQQTGQRLARALGPGPGRPAADKPEGVLVGALGTLFDVAVGQDQGRVHIHDQQLDVGVGAGGPRAGASMGPGGTEPGQPVGVLGNPLDHTPSSRGRGHRAEQLRLVTQHRQVAQAVATISQHDGQVWQHDRVGVAASRSAALPGPTSRLPPRSSPPVVRRSRSPRRVGPGR